MHLDDLSIERDVPLAPLTTLGVGGAARWFVTALRPEDIVEALAFAREQGAPVFLLGGGSNVVIADEGFAGCVIQCADFRIDVQREGQTSLLRVGAGVPWDELVAFCVTEGLAGIECMSGIPGSMGAAPIQNIGAYGQELSDVAVSVEVLDRASAEVREIPAEACDFGYRTSRFKGVDDGKMIVLSVTLRLQHGAPGRAHYPELQKALGGREEAPLDEVRRAVLAIRRRKAMLAEGKGADQRSAGSFFVNPIVSAQALEALAGSLSAEQREQLPAYPLEDGRVKLSAAWLIEAAGFARGFTLGRAGLSTRHALAITNRGGARASDIVALASLIRRGVHRQFGVWLTPEPRFIGFDERLEALLPGAAQRERGGAVGGGAGGEE